MMNERKEDGPADGYATPMAHINQKMKKNIAMGGLVAFGILVSKNVAGADLNFPAK